MDYAGARCVLSWVLVTSLAGACFAQTEPRPDPLDPSYNHDRWETQPRDIIREFRAYLTSFDGPDDNDGDGRGDLWGIPEWVSYEIKRGPDRKPYEKRPSPWLTDRELYEEGIAPRDQSYVNSGYDRGHMCMREIARRLGKNADWNTHDVLNAVPQVHAFNAGHWLSLEKRTAIWANAYGRVWVICGPVVANHLGNRRPSEWIGRNGEKKVAVPQKLFKIVVKESENPNRPDVLAFIYANDSSLNDSSLDTDHTPYLVAVRDIEDLTGLNFFSALSAADQDAIESGAATQLWSGPPEVVASLAPRALALNPEAASSLPVTDPGHISALYDAGIIDELAPVAVPHVVAVQCADQHFAAPLAALGAFLIDSDAGGAGEQAKLPESGSPANGSSGSAWILSPSS